MIIVINEGDTMTEPIIMEEIKRLDAVYHKLFYLDFASENVMPENIRDLSAVEIGIINCVSFTPDIILREIKEKLRLPNSTLTSAINRLEKRGLADRVINSRDRRSFGIRLTPEGAAAQKAHLDFEDMLWKRILSKLDTHKERDRFLEMAEKIIAAFLKEDKNNGEN